MRHRCDVPVTPGGRQVEHVSTVVPGDGTGQIGHAASAQLTAQPLDAGTQKPCVRELVVPEFAQEVQVRDVLIGTACKASQQPETLCVTQMQSSAFPGARKSRFVQERTMDGFGAVASVPIATGARVSVEVVVGLRVRDFVDFFRAQRGTHQAFGELPTENVELAGLFWSHTGLRTAAAETIASTPESARSNQVQYGMRENNSAGPSKAGHL